MCEQTHTAATRARPRSRAGLAKLLRQILGRNSICRGDERCDRGEREERRMKGQEEKKIRVAAPGLIVHCDPALSPLLFVSPKFPSECKCGEN